MDALVALVCALVTAVYLTYSSGLMKRLTHIPSAFILAASHFVAAVSFLPVLTTISKTELHNIGYDAWVGLALVGSILATSRLLFYDAYARIDVVRVTIFSSLTPIYAILIASVFQSSYPSSAQLIGIVITCICLYVFFWDKGSNMHFFQPFSRILQNTPERLAFLSTIPSAAAVVFQKELLLYVDPVVFSFGILLCISLISSTWLIIRHGSAEILLWTKSMPFHFWLLSAVTLPSMQWLFCLMVIDHHSAVALALQRSSMLFQIILAYIWLRERHDFLRCMLVSVILVIAFLLMI